MRPISLARFNALAAYCRDPRIFLTAEELNWFEHFNERVLATVIRDRTDGDYCGAIFARDALGRFRAVSISHSHVSLHHAKIKLRREMEQISHEPDDYYRQGDELGGPVDFWTPQVSLDRLHPHFLKLAEGEAYSSAREIINPMMHWFIDPDGNFIEQFQSTGFNARIWELYLFAVCTELQYALDRTAPAPDFFCRGVDSQFCMEAVTVNPTKLAGGGYEALPPRDTDEEKRAFTKHYMPIKYGSALHSKMQKRYWKQDHVNGNPLIFAIADFVAPMSMTYTRSSLPLYLYGYDYDWHHDSTGKLIVTPRRVETHNWKGKSIPSGFFNTPESENVSAILFSNSGTISKFLRMGAIAGFGSKRVRMVREGLMTDLDPNSSEPKKFRQSVNSPDYSETWAEGIDVFHNPNAIHPLEPWAIPNVAHHRILPDGQMDSVVPDWQPLTSMTHIHVDKDQLSDSI